MFSWWEFPRAVWKPSASLQSDSAEFSLWALLMGVSEKGTNLVRWAPHPCLAFRVKCTVLHTGNAIFTQFQAEISMLLFPLYPLLPNLMCVWGGGETEGAGCWPCPSPNSGQGWNYSCFCPCSLPAYYLHCSGPGRPCSHSSLGHGARVCSVSQDGTGMEPASVKGKWGGGDWVRVGWGGRGRYQAAWYPSLPSPLPALCHFLACCSSVGQKRGMDLQ